MMIPEFSRIWAFDATRERLLELLSIHDPIQNIHPELRSPT